MQTATIHYVPSTVRTMPVAYVPYTSPNAVQCSICDPRTPTAPSSSPRHVTRATWPLRWRHDRRVARISATIRLFVRSGASERTIAVVILDYRCRSRSRGHPQQPDGSSSSHRLTNCRVCPSILFGPRPRMLERPNADGWRRRMGNPQPSSKALWSADNED